jgi:hypothetical protein
MGEPDLTAAQLERTVASLRGLRIEKVTYALLTGGADGNVPEDWDYAAWHRPTMGCQLTTNTGVEFALVWESSFGEYGVEVFDQSIDGFVAGVGEPYGTAMVSAGDHPRWQALLGREITDTEVGWIRWLSGEPTPLWVRLDFEPVVPNSKGSNLRRSNSKGSNSRGPDSQEPDSVWFAAGRWDQDGFDTRTDDVTIIFDRAEAAGAELVRKP